MLHRHKYIEIPGYQNTVKQCRKCLKIKLIPFTGYCTEDISEMLDEEWHRLQELENEKSQRVDESWSLGYCGYNEARRSDCCT